MVNRELVQIFFCIHLWLALMVMHCISAGKLLPRIANHVRGVGALGALPMGALESFRFPSSPSSLLLFGLITTRFVPFLHALSSSTNGRLIRRHGEAKITVEELLA